MHIGETEQERGWWTAPEGRVRTLSWTDGGGLLGDADRGFISYSPQIGSVEFIAQHFDHRCCGYSEIFLFEHPVWAGDTESFVKWDGIRFRIYDSDYEWLRKRLWAQMDRLGAVAYVSSGVALTFVTRKADLFSSVICILSADQADRHNSNVDADT